MSKNGSPFDSAESTLQRKKGFNTEMFYRYGNIPARLNQPFPLIPRDAAPHEDLQQNSYPKTKRFRLWVDEEAIEYHKVMEKIGKGYSLLRFERIRFIPEQQHWVILVGWVDLYLEEPETAPILDKNSKPYPGYETSTFQ